MRANGYEPEDFEGDEVDIWPENHRAFLLFQRMEFQWHWAVGMGAAVRIRLDYGFFQILIARMDLSSDEYDELLSDMQVMERAALAAMKE